MKLSTLRLPTLLLALGLLSLSACNKDDDNGITDAGGSGNCSLERIGEVTAAPDSEGTEFIVQVRNTSGAEIDQLSFSTRFYLGTELVDDDFELVFDLKEGVSTTVNVRGIDIESAAEFDCYEIEAEWGFIDGNNFKECSVYLTDRCNG